MMLYFTGPPAALFEANLRTNLNGFGTISFFKLARPRRKAYAIAELTTDLSAAELLHQLKAMRYQVRQPSQELWIVLVLAS